MRATYDEDIQLAPSGRIRKGDEIVKLGINDAYEEVEKRRTTGYYEKSEEEQKAMEPKPIPVPPLPSPLPPIEPKPEIVDIQKEIKTIGEIKKEEEPKDDVKSVPEKPPHRGGRRGFVRGDVTVKRQRKS